MHTTPLPPLLALALTACGPSPETSATLVGRTNPSAEPAPSHATAWEVDEDGQTESVPGSSTTIDQDGSFMLLVDLSVRTPSDLILRAREGAIEGDGGATGSVIVSGSLNAGEDTPTAPIDAETTAETDVWLRARTDDLWRVGSMSSSWLRVTVTPELAAGLDQSPDRERDVGVLTDATVADMMAFSEALPTAGASSGSIDQALAAMAVAHAAYDLAAWQSDADEETRTAARALDSAVRLAWTDAGWSETQIAVAAQASADVSVALTRDATAEVRAAHRAGVELRRADTVLDATLAGMTTLGASASTMTSVQDAGAALRGRLEATFDAGENAGAETADAWTNFRVSVETALAEELSTTQAGVIFTVQAALGQAVGDLLDALEGARVEASVSTAVQDVVDAYADFWTSATAEARLDLFTDVGLTADEAHALLTVLAQLELATS